MKYNTKFAKLKALPNAKLKALPNIKFYQLSKKVSLGKTITEMFLRHFLSESDARGIFNFYFLK